MHWGKAIAVVREVAGMRQAELSRLVGISKTSMSLIENGKTKPTADTLDRICNVFGIDPVLIGFLAIYYGKMSEMTRIQVDRYFPDFEPKVMTIIRSTLVLRPWKSRVNSPRGPKL